MIRTSILLAAAALAVSSPAALGQTHPTDTTETEATRITVNVKGMVCDFCARAVTKVFGKNNAVDTVHVDLDAGEIHVGLKPGAHLPDDDVEAMVQKSGYAMVSLERDIL